MSLKNLALYHQWVGEKSREILKTLSEEDFRKKINETIGSVRQKGEHIVHALLFCFIKLKAEVDHLGTDFNQTIQNITQLTDTDLLT
ncbi:MAG: DinB family protein [Candidatus Hodarchaeales archaeon]